MIYRSRVCTLFLLCFLSSGITGSLGAQCPEFLTTNISGNTGVLCEGDMVTITQTGQNIPAGSSIDWYIGSGSSYNPYGGQGTLIGSNPVVGMPCAEEPEILYIMVNPDNTQVGSSGDQCDEFLVLWTGSGGFDTDDILVSNLANGTFSWDVFIAGNAANFSCGTALSPGTVPENSILIIQSSVNNNVFINIDNLCATGLPVYIIAYTDVDCTGGYFDNSSPCSSCPVEIDIAGDCVYDIELDYMPPGSAPNGWAWANTGPGIYADVVPVLDIPTYSPGGITIPPFTWTIPSDFCETFGEDDWYLVGILDPPPGGACPDIFSPYFEMDISCAELEISGGGDICAGNCPTAPTRLNLP